MKKLSFLVLLLIYIGCLGQDINPGTKLHNEYIYNSQNEKDEFISAQIVAVETSKTYTSNILKDESYYLLYMEDKCFYLQSMEDKTYHQQSMEDEKSVEDKTYYLQSNEDETLLWSDEFNGSGAPDSTKWSYDLGAHGYGNNEIQNYTNALTNSRQEGGILIIEAHKSRNEWTSARLLSHKKFTFTYGRLVFRAKLPSGSGTWPALWMLAEDIEHSGWPEGGEIDVMEHVGKNPGITQCALHTTSSSGNTVNKKEFPVPDFNTAFHLYEANWTKDKIDFSVDGKLYYTYNPSEKNAETWPFEKPFFIIMNIAIGGNWGSDTKFESGGLKNGIDPTITSAKMEVDYVRVYKTSGNLE